MRVLVVHRVDGAFGYITDSIINAFRDKGHTVQRWDGLVKTWQAFAPDLYIGCSSHKQPIPPRSNCKIAIHVNPYGPTDLGGINESKENMRWTMNQNPDAVFGYGHEDDRIFWSYWESKNGIKWVPMPTAGDKTIFKVIPDINKLYDIVYLGGKWAYKSITIDSYLMPVINESRLSYKIHGWGDWPSNVFSGQLSTDRSCRFLNSGKIGPCISEQHTHTYNIDIPERAFKVALSGTLVIHDPTVAIRRMIPSAIIASNPNQFKEYCYHFCKEENTEERIKITERQRNEVLSANTYHHRVSTLLSALGFNKEANQMVVD